MITKSAPKSKMQSLNICLNSQTCLVGRNTCILREQANLPLLWPRIAVTKRFDSWKCWVTACKSSASLQ